MGGVRGQHIVLLLAAALAATLLCLAELMLHIDVDTDSAAHRFPAPRRVQHSANSARGGEEGDDDDGDGDGDGDADVNSVRRPSALRGRAQERGRTRARGSAGSMQSFFADFPSHAQRADYSCTLVTQTSLSRLQYVKGAVSEWPGPVVIALAVANGAPSASEAAALRALRLPPSVDVLWGELGSSPTAFPINTLRNAAIARVTTSHFLLTDVDFWPSRSVYAEFLKLKPNLLRCKRCAFIAPSFALKTDADGKVLAEVHRRLACEGTSCLDGSLIPRTTAQLKAAIRLGGHSSAAGVQKFCRPCHASSSVNWKRWPHAHNAYRIECLKSHRFEPYFIAPALSTTPQFVEAFVGCAFALRLPL